MTKKQLSVIGAGSWGSALAFSLANKYKNVHLWCYSEKEKNELHPFLIKQKNILPTLSLAEIMDSQAVLIVPPSHAFSQTLHRLKPYLSSHKHLAFATKGFDSKNKCLLSETFKNILPEQKIVFISGPSFASEVIMQKPTALVVSSKYFLGQKYWIDAIASKTLRIYSNKDIIGTQIGAGTKNIFAIATGIASALDYGANTQAALITRSLAEMVRFGVSLGAKKNTFMGLTGLGDLILTCSDNLSRNRRFGKVLVQYGDIKLALKKINGVVEGLNAIEFVLELAQKKQIEMPICEQVYAVVKEHITPKEALKILMSRAQIEEY